MSQDYILITDIFSVDPDDVFTLLLSLNLKLNLKGVITTHFFPEKRAKVAKLILSELNRKDIPVYVGEGLKYSDTFSLDSRNKFLKKNPLFPVLFGFPKGVAMENEKIWFPNFLKAYYEIYGQELIESQNVEQESGTNFLIRMLQNHDENNKLKVICIAPMFQLENIPDELFKNMDLFVMGGGFENNIDEFIQGNKETLEIPKAGYNWGICPETTKIVLNKLSKTNTTLKLISSGIVRRNKVYVDLNTYEKWINMLKDKNVSTISRAIMLDWDYCNKGNKLSDHKNLCDPLTLYLALTNKYKSIKLNTTIENENKFVNYLQQLDVNLINMKKNNSGNTELIIDFDSDTGSEILKNLTNILFESKL